MKKQYRLLTLLVLIAILIPACASSAPDCSQLGIFCVGLVTNISRIDDKSFNQSAWAGLQQARKDGIINWIQYIETSDGRDYGRNITVFADAGYDAIVTVGASLASATIAAAAKFPKSYFIRIDQTQVGNQVVPANLVDLNFPEDKAGYLVGALAAAMSTSHRIGAVCGPDTIPYIWRYCEGYRAGAAYADVKLNLKTRVSVTYDKNISLGKTFSDPTWGANTADSLVNNGADVIFGVGGTTGSSAIVEASLKGVYVIGVDIDQYYTLPEAAPMMLSSAIKLETPGVAELIQKARDAQIGKIVFPSGNYTGMAGFAPFHDLAGKVPENINIMMNQLNTSLLDGSILTNISPATP